MSSPASETFILNEITFWSGVQHVAGSGLRWRSQNPKQDLRETQQYLLAGDFRQAEKQSQERLESRKNNFGTNLAPGKLVINANGHQNAAGFRRHLSLSDAVAEVQYQANGYNHRRKYFISHPHQVLVVQFESEDPNGMHLEVSVEGGNEAFWTAAEDGRIEFTAQALETIHSDGKSGVKGQGVVSVQTKSGKLVTRGDELVVDGGKEVTIILAFNTGYQQKGNAWKQKATQQVRQAKSFPIADVLGAHIVDHQALYLQTSLTLKQRSPQVTASTDKRKQSFKARGFSDPGLFELYFNYGRYLSIAGSRADSPLPMHLQGLWNDGEACQMGWSCDYHLDINTQMNNFPTMTCGLADVTGPLVSYLRQLANAGRGAARECYGCPGWVAHVFSNVWGFADPGWDTSYGLNVTGGLWLASHLIEIYEYTQDDGFLAASAYPILKGAADFFLEYMIEDPETGWLLPGPSVSPENSFWVTKHGRKTEHHLSLAPTLDVSLLLDLFAFCTFASRRLGVDMHFGAQTEKAMAKLPPFQIGKNGQLQEWLQDYEEAQPDHRHLSHTVPLCRSSLISVRHEPQLAEAVRISLQRRQVRCDLEDIEFTAALVALNYARLNDGDEALAQIGHLIADLSFDNLLSFSKPGVAGAEANIFVVDGNFGGAAAIAEMLLRSIIRKPGGPVEVDILPALPKSWPDGKVAGLRARGNVEIDIEWVSGKLAVTTVNAMSLVSFEVHYGSHFRSIIGPGRFKLDSTLSLV